MCLGLLAPKLVLDGLSAAPGAGPLDTGGNAMSTETEASQLLPHGGLLGVE